MHCILLVLLYARSLTTDGRMGGRGTTVLGAGECLQTNPLCPQCPLSVLCDNNTYSLHNNVHSTLLISK